MTTEINVCRAYGSLTPALGAATPEFESRVGVAFAGGTFQCRNSSPDGMWECEGSDVGGVRRRRAGATAWENMPTAAHDADRKVSGCVILDNGTMFSLVGNGSSSGRILEYAADGSVKPLQTGLHILANGKSTGDTYARTRPVGWTLWFDPVNNLLYACTENGLYRFDRATGNGSIIALQGESLRGFVHDDAITVGEATQLTVCSQKNGVIRVNNVKASASTTAIGSPDRAEDGAFTPAGNIIAACHFQGVYRINPSDGSSVNITPFDVVVTHGSTGNNGGNVLWSAVDVHPQTGIAVVTMINPTHAHGWVFKTTKSADIATAEDWESITHTPITLREGIKYAQPKARVPGGSANSGVGLTGGQHISYIRNDSSGNTIKTLNTLTTGLTENATEPDHSQVTWVSDVKDSSLLSMLDIAVSESGAMAITMADHNSMTSPSLEAATNTELTRLGVSGLGDGFGITAVGNTWVFCPVDDAHWEHSDHTWRYFAGSGAPSEWKDVGWQSYNWNNAADFPSGIDKLPDGIPPRPVSVCGYNRGDGTIRFLGMADGVGFVYQDYNSSSDSWSDPRISQGGPTSNIISQRLNTTRASQCTANGSVVLHLLQKNGHIYRSLDQGQTVARIATGSNGPEIAANPSARTGFMRINDAGDYAVVSNKDGIYVIKGLSNANPEVVKLSTETGPIAIDQATGATYIHIRSSGPVQLLEFSDISSATDLNAASNVAPSMYSTHLGDQANQLYATNRDGRLYLVTLYQGGGLMVSHRAS